MSPETEPPAIPSQSEASPLSEELQLEADPRLQLAIEQFNAGDWHECHDGFEELWHETQGPSRPVLQGILQIAVGQLHWQRRNRHGATVLTGEGLGRLRTCEEQALGLDLEYLRSQASLWLLALQSDSDTQMLPRPQLRKLSGAPR